MWLTRVTIAPPGGAATAVDTARLVDAIWAGVEVADRVEHITVVPGPGRIEIGVFTLPPDGTGTFSAARGVVRRALLRSPPWRQWTILDPFR